MYLASSVARHLEDLKERHVITVKDTELDSVKCPAKPRCKPDTCVKGRNETCKKKVEVVYTHKGRESLVNLLFWYQLQNRRNEGYIECEDSSLNKLIKRGVIDRNALVCA